MNFLSLTFKHLWKRFFGCTYLLIMLLTCLHSKMSGYSWNWIFCEALTKLLLASFYSCIYPNIRGELGWYLSSTLMWLISTTLSWKMYQTWVFTNSPSKKVTKISFYVYACFSSLLKETTKKKKICLSFTYFMVTAGSKLYIKVSFLLRQFLFTLIASIWILKTVSHCLLQYLAVWRMTESISLWKYTSV